MDDLDIYGDLDAFHDQEEKKSKALLSLETKYEEALKTIEAMKLEKKDLREKIRIMEQNLQSLLDTARAEIRRKDKMIEELRKEKDDLCFRRKRVEQRVPFSKEQKPATVKNELRNSSQNADPKLFANVSSNANVKSKIENDVPSTSNKDERLQSSSRLAFKGKLNPFEQLVDKFKSDAEKEDKSQQELETRKSDKMTKQKYDKTSDSEKSRYHDRHDGRSKDKWNNRSPSPRHREKSYTKRRKEDKGNSDKRNTDDHRTKRRDGRQYERKDRSRSRDRHRSKSDRRSKTIDNVKTNEEKRTGRREEKYDKSSRSNREDDSSSRCTSENSRDRKRRHSEERDGSRNTKKFSSCAKRSPSKECSNLDDVKRSNDNHLVVEYNLFPSLKEAVYEKSIAHSIDVSEKELSSQESASSNSNASTEKDENILKLQQNENENQQIAVRRNVDKSVISANKEHAITESIERNLIEPPYPKKQELLSIEKSIIALSETFEAQQNERSYGKEDETNIDLNTKTQINNPSPEKLKRVIIDHQNNNNEELVSEKFESPEKEISYGKEDESNIDLNAQKQICNPSIKQLNKVPTDHQKDSKQEPVSKKFESQKNGRPNAKKDESNTDLNAQKQTCNSSEKELNKVIAAQKIGNNQKPVQINQHPKNNDTVNEDEKISDQLTKENLDLMDLSNDESSVAARKLSLFYKLFGGVLSNDDIEIDTASENNIITLNNSNSSSLTTSPDLYTDISEAPSRSSAKLFQSSPIKSMDGIKVPKPEKSKLQTVFTTESLFPDKNESEKPNLKVSRIHFETKTHQKSASETVATNCDTMSFDNLRIMNKEKQKKIMNIDEDTCYKPQKTKEPINIMETLDSKDETTQDQNKIEKINAKIADLRCNTKEKTKSSEGSFNLNSIQTIAIDDDIVESQMSSSEHDLQSVCLVDLSDDETTTNSTSQNTKKIVGIVNKDKLATDSSQRQLPSKSQRSTNSLKVKNSEEVNQVELEKSSSNPDNIEEDFVLDSDEDDDDDDLEIVSSPEKMKDEIEGKPFGMTSASHDAIVLDNDDDSSYVCDLALSSDEEDTSLAEIQKKLKEKQKEKIEILENIRIPMPADLKLRAQNGVAKKMKELEKETVKKLIDEWESDFDEEKSMQYLAKEREELVREKKFETPTSEEISNDDEGIVDLRTPDPKSLRTCKERRSLSEHNGKLLDTNVKPTKRHSFDEILSENIQESTMPCQSQPIIQLQSTNSPSAATKRTRISMKNPIPVQISKIDKKESEVVSTKRKRSSSPIILQTCDNVSIKTGTRELSTSAEVRDMLVNGRSSQISQSPQDIIYISPVNIMQDTNLDQLDKDMQAIFQSPAKFDFTDHPPCGNSTKLDDVTINETVNKNSTTFDSPPIVIEEIPNKSNDSSFGGSKRLSLGTSDYVYERVSENVVNLFITRRRGKKRPKIDMTMQNNV